MSFMLRKTSKGATWDLPPPSNDMALPPPPAHLGAPPAPPGTPPLFPLSLSLSSSYFGSCSDQQRLKGAASPTDQHLQRGTYHPQSPQPKGLGLPVQKWPQ
jgi:hypothetical protein